MCNELLLIICCCIYSICICPVLVLHSYSTDLDPPLSCIPPFLHTPALLLSYVPPTCILSLVLPPYSVVHHSCPYLPSPVLSCLPITYLSPVLPHSYPVSLSCPVLPSHDLPLSCPSSFFPVSLLSFPAFLLY